MFCPVAHIGAVWPLWRPSGLDARESRSAEANAALSSYPRMRSSGVIVSPWAEMENATTANAAVSISC